MNNIFTQLGFNNITLAVEVFKALNLDPNLDLFPKQVDKVRDIAKMLNKSSDPRRVLKEILAKSPPPQISILDHAWKELGEMFVVEEDNKTDNLNDTEDNTKVVEEINEINYDVQ